MTEIYPYKRFRDDYRPVSSASAAEVAYIESLTPEELKTVILSEIGRKPDEIEPNEPEDGS